VERELVHVLEHDRWPEPAASAAEALASFCHRPSVLALRRSLKRGGDVGLRSLASYAACKPPYLVRDLISIVSHNGWGLSARQQAVQLLVESTTRDQRDQPAAAFRGLRQRAARDPDDLAVAVALALALGRIGGPTAAAALADTLALDPHRALRVAAARAIGVLCARSAQDALRSAARDADPLIRRVARSAAKRCRFTP
jgi:hypothetical protein